jgi:hypothetical protein
MQSHESHDTEWMASLVEQLLKGSTAAEIDNAARDLLALWERLKAKRESHELADSMLEAVERTRPPSGWLLVEVAFPRVYTRVVSRKESLWWSPFAGLLAGWHWDHARSLRHWLVDTYVSLEWPPESFLRCLKGDLELFRRVVAHGVRSERSQEALAYLRRLPSTLDAHPDLASHWRRVVDKALSNPYAPVDYD